jgi:hypothetical protein
MANFPAHQQPRGVQFTHRLCRLRFSAQPVNRGETLLLKFSYVLRVGNRLGWTPIAVVRLSGCGSRVPSESDWWAIQALLGTYGDILKFTKTNGEEFNPMVIKGYNVYLRGLARIKKPVYAPFRGDSLEDVKPEGQITGLDNIMYI